MVAVWWVLGADPGQARGTFAPGAVFVHALDGGRTCPGARQCIRACVLGRRPEMACISAWCCAVSELAA